MRFYAWGALRLLGLENGLLGFRGGVSTSLLELGARVLPSVEAGAYTDAVATIEVWMLERERASRRPEKLESAGRALYASGGNARVKELAAMLSLSARQLERHFKGGAGVPPKALGRLIRFERASQHLMREPDADLTALAFELGFADQAHFIREFRAYARRTPGAFAASVRRSRWFQDRAGTGQP